MNALAHVGLVDLVIALLVVGSVLGALRRRAGLLGALASGVGTAIVLWIVAGAVVVWASAPVAGAVADSALLTLVPPPSGALRQLGALVLHQVSAAGGPVGRP